jgi:type II restriction/modification system DNA methylase subunit YeeA
MDTSKLKKFAQFARRTLMGQVSAKLESVLAPGAAARREHPEAMKKLEAAIARDGKGQVIERVAYIWFNRFSALRFMDVNDLNPVRVVSPLSGQFQPEILAEAKAGNIDEDRVPDKVRAQVRALLDGRAPSPDAQSEAYRLLLVAICNDWHRVMPFLFERIDDYTELLLPEDLLSNASILAYLREAMTPDVCEDVEVIGWLYQFYISEKKDEVFAGLKKNVKISADNIPAATQLFTPHWIVRYLVENSLGRLWMLNRPGSRLKERMDYYIAPEEPEADFLRITSPEEIKVCDPACGSGHMLTYAFDLLHAIYEEEGYDAAEIPGLILANNLYGVEIDERAGALAAFALTMKAAGRRKRFLRRAGKDVVQPKICVLENISFKDDELVDYVKEVGRDLFTADLRETLGQFTEAKNLGSLIVPKLKDVAELRRVIAAKQFENNLFLRDVHERVLASLRMADYLSSKYHVVVANPPYMGGKGMNGKLGDFAKAKYPDSKSDLFAMFIERALAMSTTRGMVAMINMQSWMFLSSYEKLRASILADGTILTMAHLGERAFDTIGGAVVSTTAFVLANAHHPNQRGDYLRLTAGRSEAEKIELLSRAARSERENRYCVSAAQIQSIPGQPIVYWQTERFYELFRQLKGLADIAKPRQGATTSDNERFLRVWSEVSTQDIGFGFADRASAASSGKKWFPYNKGGEFRRWYGNQEFIINYAEDGKEIKEFHDELNKLRPGGRLKNQEYYFRNCVSWSKISTGSFAARYFPDGFIFDVAGSAVFFDSQNESRFYSGVLNSCVTTAVLQALSPTLNFEAEHLSKIPVLEDRRRGTILPDVELIVRTILRLSKADWDSYETSWEFAGVPVLSPEHRAKTLKGTYAHVRANWRSMTEEMARLEEQNNRIFIDAYGLEGELTPEVAPEEITLTCNPAYRYGGQKPEAELEGLLLADTMRELISYAVGCMFGRYSLDAPGLILANQGEGLKDYRAKVPNPTFEPDADNVIPVIDGDWFADDIAARFRRFLRVIFGEEHFQENLAFVEAALGKDIRRYFTRDFFNDHVKRYKKRPIYWLFSSPKGTFNALIYMHRYRADTVSVVLNDYLREFRSKLEAYRRAQEALSISGDASPAQKTKALKEIEATAREIEEIDAWEREVLFPLATQKIEIDLNDGVKANYPKFGAALKPIKGLNDSDD